MINTNNLQRDHGLNGTDYHAQFAAAPTVDWTTPGLYISRLRLIGDFGILDVSYCHGQLADGTNVNVELPFSQIPLRGHRRVIVGYARKTGKFIRGVLDNISILH